MDCMSFSIPLLYSDSIKFQRIVSNYHISLNTATDILYWPGLHVSYPGTPAFPI